MKNKDREISGLVPGLQITVVIEHWPTKICSNEIPNVFGHDSRTNFFFRKSFYGKDE